MENKGTKTLETGRLILRKFRIEDAEEMFHNWASDPQVTAYLTWPAHADVSGTRALLQDWTGKYADSAYYNWVIEWKETHEVIGNISVVELNERVEAADIGYCMTKALWGKGIMPEALKVVVQFLFEEVGVNRVCACHDSNNPKSGRVMEKAGMKWEGTLREAGINNQGRCDIVWYSILRQEYLAGRI